MVRQVMMVFQWPSDFRMGFFRHFEICIKKGSHWFLFFDSKFLFPNMLDQGTWDLQH